MVTDDHPTSDPAASRSSVTSSATGPTAADRIATEAARFDAVLAESDPAAPVPACPDWTALDLLWHGAEVHEFWSTLLATRALTAEDAEAAEAAAAPRPEGPDARERILGRRRAATAALLEQLAARDDAEEAWTWFPADRSVGFTRRMQVHEATVHRVDAEMAAGLDTLSPIDRAVAVDGLDHVLAVMWAAGHDWIPEWAEIETLAVLRVEPDADGAGQDVEIARWSGTRPRDGQTFEALVARPWPAGADPSGLPRATATGPVTALYLWAWGRGDALARLDDGPAAVEVSGDREAVDVVEALIAQGID